MWPWQGGFLLLKPFPRGLNERLSSQSASSSWGSKSFIPKGGLDIESQSLRQEGKAVWDQAGKDSEGRPDQAAGKQEAGLLSRRESE